MQECVTVLLLPVSHYFVNAVNNPYSFSDKPIMAKNLENTSYRNLDVDAFDPEKFEDCEESETPVMGPDERLVNQLLQSAKLQEALKAALSNPPLKCKNQVCSK